MLDRRDEMLENSSAKFDGESEAARMVQRYEYLLKEAQNASIRNETGPDCE